MERPLETFSPEHDRELIGLNVEAVVALTHGLLPAMLERGRGGVINLASIVAFQPMPTASRPAPWSAA